MGLKRGMSQTVLMRLWAIMIIEETGSLYILDEVWDISVTSIIGNFLVARVSFVVIFSGIVALICLLYYS
jgi:hypothetical protein